MSQAPGLFFFGLLFILFTPAYSHPQEHVHECIHDHLDFEPEILDLPPETDLEGRILQTYSNIRIIFDFSTLTGVSDEFVNYVKNSLLPPAQNFLQAALKVKPGSGKLKATSPTTCSDLITFPSIYTSTGVDADLVMFLTQTNEPSQSFIAYAGACNLDPVTYRPVFGRLNFNMYLIGPSTSDATIERDTSVILHETTHALGFSKGLYDFYIDPTTNVPITGHYFNKTVNGLTVSVLNLGPLTTRLRTFYNCPTLEGVYLENQGGSGSAGSHFERRVIYNDYMTASAIKDTRITQFALALLEGTGWYQVDYSLAEPVTYGKNEGCSFFDGLCMNTATKTANFEEFCSPIGSSGCSWTLRGAGVCGSNGLSISSSLPAQMDYWGNKTIVSDTFADNCPTYQIYGNMDCEDTTNQAKSQLKDYELFALGSKCFMGTISPGGGYYTAPRGYCFKPTCESQAGGTYLLKVNIGNSTVVSCPTAGDITISGFGGVFSCPDPNKFCNQINTEGFCKRSCSARGSCVNQECQCVDGWTFHDCSKRTYVDNCARCAGLDPKKTSCYGDTCECNPSNTVCMCQLGLLTGSACNSVPASGTSTPTSGTGTTATSGTGTTATSGTGTTPTSGTGTTPPSGTGTTSTSGTGSTTTSGTGTTPTSGTQTTPTSSITGTNTGNTSGDGGNANNNNTTSQSNDDNSVNPGIIVGIVGGALVGVAGLALGIKFGIKLLARATSRAALTPKVVRVTPLPNTSTLSTQRIDTSSPEMRGDTSRFSPGRSDMNTFTERAITLE